MNNGSTKRSYETDGEYFRTSPVASTPKAHIIEYDAEFAPPRTKHTAADMQDEDHKNADKERKRKSSEQAMAPTKRRVANAQKDDAIERNSK